MQYRYLVSVLLAAFLLALAPAGRAAELTELPKSEQADIARRCLPVQYREGAAAYRDCVSAEVSARDGKNTAAINRLTFDDQYAVQQACSFSASSDYQKCVESQISELAAIPEPLIADLSDDEQYALQQSCFSAQTSEGAAAYRTCINSAITALSQLPVANLSALPLLERNALQLRCSAIHTDAANYRRCLLDATGTPSEPPLASTNSAEEETLNQTTSSDEMERELPTAATIDNRSTTVDSERRPTASESTPTAVTQDLPATDTDDAPATVDSAEPALAADASVSVPIDDSIPRLNIDAPVANVDTTAANTLPDNNTTAIESAGDDSLIQPDVTDKPVEPPSITSEPGTLALATGADGEDVRTTALDSSVDSVDEADTLTAIPDQSASSTGIAGNDSNRGADAQNSLAFDVDSSGSADPKDDTVLTRLLTTVAGLDTIGKALLGAALLLPLLLFGTWATSRGREFEEEYEGADFDSPMLDRGGPSLHQRESERRESRLREEADDLFGESSAFPIKRKPVPVHDSTASHHGHLDTRQPDHLPGGDAANAATRIPDDNEVQYAESDMTRLAVKPELSHRLPATDQQYNARQSEFGRWLPRQEPSLQLQYTIEFLIYWIAYGDERYDPAAKALLFQDQAPDEHDLIKRWVLQEDVFAFADAIHWMQDNSSSRQRIQTIDLLMALLVTDSALTPTQNVILRFLGDAFGLGEKTLDARYSEAFGEPLPPLARVDKPAWWKRQIKARMLGWDAHSIAMRPDDEQHRIRLGLELETNVDDSVIAEHFRRAAWRCHPDRFDALSERERKLAERQYEKLEMARDQLLEVHS